MKRNNAKKKSGLWILIAFLAVCTVYGLITGAFHQTDDEPSDVRSAEAETDASDVSEPVIWTVDDPAEEPAEEPLALSEPEPPAEEISRETPAPVYEEKQTERYVLNTNSKKIHKSTCSDVSKIKPENSKEVEDLTEYLAQGYTNCGHCGGCS